MELRLPFPLVLLSLATSTYAQTIAAPPSSSAAGASGPLTPSYAGFGIEPSNLFSFTGGNSANDFSIQLLQNLADYSGAPPHIRLGGNTGDYMVYDDGYSSYDFQRNGQDFYASNYLTFGPGFFRALDRFPSGTPVTYQLNLAYNDPDYIANIVKEAQAVLDNLGDLELTSFEIGNEPDLYNQNGFRPGAWSGQIYTQEFLERASAIYEQVLRPAGLPAQFFESPATASTIGTTFTTNDLVSYGLTQGRNGSGNFIQAWNQHNYFYFVDVTPYPLTLEHLMELSNTESQFAHWAAEVRDSLATGLPYHLREMASAGPIGLPDISNTFGASLWNLNFFLYAATLNISSVQMHMTDNSYASPWMPFTRTGYQIGVRPSYYAFAAITQIVGSGNGTTQVAPVTPSGLSGDYTNYVRSYGIYAGQKISAIAIINARPANESMQQKGGVTFRLTNLPAGETLYLSTLTAAGSDSLAGSTWNGISFEENSDGTPQTVNETIATVTVSSSGEASVYVRDSQAVVANLGFQLGTRAVSVAGGTEGSGSSRRPSAASSSTGQGAKSAVLLSLLTTAVFAIFGQC
jgi:hypothetical protein